MAPLARAGAGGEMDCRVKPGNDDREVAAVASVGGDVREAALAAGVALAHEAAPRHVDHQVAAVAGLQANPGAHAQHVGAALGGIELFAIAGFSDLAGVEAEPLRAAERRVGIACGSPCRYQWTEQQSKKNISE